MSLGNTTADGNKTKTQSPKTKTRNPKIETKPKQSHKPKTRYSSSPISFELMPQSFKNFPRLNNFKFYIFRLIQNTVSWTNKNRKVRRTLCTKMGWLREMAWSVRCISRDSDTACWQLAGLPKESFSDCWARWLQSCGNSCALFYFYFFIILMAMILSRNRSILQVQVRWSNKKVDCF